MRTHLKTNLRTNLKIDLKKKLDHSKNKIDDKTEREI